MAAAEVTGISVERLLKMTWTEVNQWVQAKQDAADILPADG